jgi:hypothetical protein
MTGETMEKRQRTDWFLGHLTTLFQMQSL